MQRTDASGSDRVCTYVGMRGAAGWFVTYTCLTWIPVVYSSVNLYLVTHPIQLGKGVSIRIIQLNNSLLVCK